jgi:UDP-3-O-[3-hydroxymyristoyl] N-acetylglucosamine deacetylase/3-hydroxyacyl-[acyl-carrier-protein] dehydratase
MEQQLTIKSAVEIEGVGLHTGAKTRMRLLPAEQNAGISFVRVDLPGEPVIKANIANVMESSRKLRRTSLAFESARYIRSRLMAALSGMAIET